MADAVARIKLALEGSPAVAQGLKAVEGQVSSLKTMVAGLGAGLSVAALAQFVQGAINAADEMSKLSQKTGVAVKDLAGLQLAYQLSGNDAKSLETSLGRLSKTVTENNAAFDAMGVKTRAANGEVRPMRDILADVADKFASYSDGATKSALAQELFGRTGAELIPLLNSGADGLREMDEMAQRLGLTMDQQTAQAAEKFNDTVELLHMGSQGLARQMAAQLLPTLVTITGELLNSKDSTLDLSTASRVLGNVLKGLFTLLAGGIQIASNFGRFIGASAAALVQVVNGDFKGAWQTMTSMQEDNRTKWQQTASMIGRVWDDAGSQGVDAMATLAGAARKAHAPVVETGNAAKKAAKEAKDELAALLNKLNAKEVGLDPKYAQELATLYKGWQQGRLGVDAYRDAVEKLIRQQKFAKDAHEAMVEAMNREADLRLEMAKSAAQRVDDLLDENKRMREEVDTMGLSAQQITKRAIALNDATIAEKQQQLARLQSNLISTREQAALEEEIRLLQERNGILSDKSARQGVLDAQKEQIDMWKSIDQTAHDVFVNIFEDGAGTFKRLGQTLKSALLDWLYQMTVKRWIINIAAGFTGMDLSTVASALSGSSGGISAGGVLNGASTAYNAYSLFSGTGGSINAISSLFGGGMSFGNAAGSVYANTFGGLYGGDGISALLSTNGAYGTAGAGWGSAAAGLGVVALPLIVGALFEKYGNNNQRMTGAATSANTGTPNVIAGSTSYDMLTGALPDREELLKQLYALGAPTGSIDKLNDRALMYLLQGASAASKSESDSGPFMNWKNWVKNYQDLPDFYKGEGYANPEALGWWANDQYYGSGAAAQIMNERGISPELVQFSRSLALGVADPYNTISKVLGGAGGYTATAGLAYDPDHNKGWWAGLNVKDASGASVVDFGKREGAGTGETYKNQGEALKAMFSAALGGITQLGTSAVDAGSFTSVIEKSVTAALQAPPPGAGSFGTASDSVMTAAGQQALTNAVGSAAPAGSLSGNIGGLASESASATVLPEWVKKQVADAKASIDALTGDDVGQKAAEIYQTATANIAGTLTTIKQLIDVVPSFAGSTQDVVYNIAEASGGMETFQQRLGGYYQNFYSQSERQAIATGQMTEQFKALGVEVPKNRAEYRKLVESTIAAGAGSEKLAADLLALGDTVAAVYQEIEVTFGQSQQLTDTITSGLLGTFDGTDIGATMAQQTTDGIYAALAGGFAQQITSIVVDGVVNPMISAAVAGSLTTSTVSAAVIADMVAKAQAVASVIEALFNDEGFKTLMESIGKAVESIKIPTLSLSSSYHQATAATKSYTSALQSSTSATDKIKSAWSDITDNLLEQVQKLRGEVADASQESLAYWQSQFAIATAQARAGDQDAAKSLVTLSDYVSKAASEQATSLLELQTIRAATAQSLQDTAAYTHTYAKSGTPSTSSVSYAAVSPLATTTAPVVVAADPGLVAEMKDFKAKNQALLENIEAKLRELYEIERRRENIGMPPTRQAVLA